jgi:hypothetical protein
VAALAAGLIAVPVSAQVQVPKGEWTSNWAASFGVDPFKTDGTLNVSENFSAAIAKQWSRTGSRLGYRAQLTAGRQPSITSQFNVLTCSTCSVTRTTRYAELSGAAVMTFRSGGNVKPYLLAGPGIYRVSTSYFARGVVLGNSENPSESTAWSLGLSAGAGATLRLFGKELFIEQRILFPQASTGYRSGPVLHPLSIGVKFEK